MSEKPKRRACAGCGGPLPAHLIAEDKWFCADKSACVGRALQRMVTKPYVGFNPEEAYKNAPKYGDAA